MVFEFMLSVKNPIPTDYHFGCPIHIPMVVLKFQSDGRTKVVAPLMTIGF